MRRKKIDISVIKPPQSDMISREMAIQTLSHLFLKEDGTISALQNCIVRACIEKIQTLPGVEKEGTNES